MYFSHLLFLFVASILYFYPDIRLKTYGVAVRSTTRYHFAGAFVLTVGLGVLWLDVLEYIRFNSRKKQQP